MVSRELQDVLILIIFLAIITRGSAINSAKYGANHQQEKRQVQNSSRSNTSGEGGRYLGVAVDAKFLQSNPKYTQIVEKSYQVLTPGNEMKWESIEKSQGKFNYEKGDFIVQTAKKNKQKVRGHTLIWHRQFPQHLKSLKSATEVKEAMRKHIESFMEHFAKNLIAIDVVNEPIETKDPDGIRNDKTPWMTHIGKSYIKEAFTMTRESAKKHNPDIKLYINDFSIEGKNDKSNRLFKLVKELKSQNLIDGVGFQAHLIVGQVPKDMKENLERFAALGVEISITELDIRMKTNDKGKIKQLEEQQAKDYLNVLEICEQLKACVGVTIWGVGEEDSWIPQEFKGEGNALPFDRDYQPKIFFSQIEAKYKKN